SRRAHGKPNEPLAFRVPRRGGRQDRRGGADHDGRREAHLIDERAVVSPKAEIHADAYVGPYAIIGDDVVIGRGTRIEAHAVVKGPTTIGEDNRIFQFASVGDDPQDKKYAGEPTRL